MSRRAVSAAVAAAFVTIVVSGCSGYVSPRFGGPGEEEGPGYEQYMEDQREQPPEEPPSEAEIRQMTEDKLAELGLGRWHCSYDPTMNDDWHDDVLCSDGNQFDRPYLRDGDSFVTYDEIMLSAQEYEDQLNAGR